MQHFTSNSTLVLLGAEVLSCELGLEINFRQLLPNLRGGKPLLLYACRQTLNLILTLAMA